MRIAIALVFVALTALPARCGPGPEPGREWLTRGRSAMLRGDRAEARAAFEKVLEVARWPGHGEIYYLTWSAREELHRLLRGTAEHPEPCCLAPFGAAWELRQQLQERLAEQRDLDLDDRGVPDPGLEAALVAKARLLRRLGEIRGETPYDRNPGMFSGREQAVDLLAELVQRHRMAAPGQASARLARLLGELGCALVAVNAERATDTLEEGLAMMDSTNLQEWKYRGPALGAALEASLRRQDRAATEALLPRFEAGVTVASPPEHRAHLADVRARLALLRGSAPALTLADAVKAAAGFEPLLPAGHPRLPGLFRRAGDACLEAGRPDEAADWYRKRLALVDYPGSVWKREQEEARALVAAADRAARP